LQQQGNSAVKSASQDEQIGAASMQDTRPLSIHTLLGVKTRPMPGVPAKVWLVGAGPGDPGLITARARDVLADAEVVLTDALASPLLLEFCPQAEVHNVGKRFGEDSAAQLAINQQLIELALQGRRVVRLKGGDPLLFARGGEEALALKQAGIRFEIVPGISSPVAASAYAGIPLTHRELSKSVTFITGSDRAGKEWSPEAWKRLATATDTICVLMGMRRIEEITHAILEGGRDPRTPAAVIQWARSCACVKSWPGSIPSRCSARPCCCRARSSKGASPRRPSGSVAPKPWCCQ
jgi:uroporphyrin-III C-methyltransferase